MRIHTNIADGPTIHHAAQLADARVFRLEAKGSRSHSMAFEVNLSGNSPRRTQADRDEYAATYDQWGVFLAHLYVIEPTMKAGPYRNVADFRVKTHGAY